MRRFAYACLGILALALAVHLGTETARAGATGPFIGIAGGVANASTGVGYFVAITADGEWWRMNVDGTEWQRGGVIGGGVAVEPSTWGQIKARGGR